MFGKRFFRALAIFTVGTLVMTTAAFADDITNDVPFDVVAGTDVVALAAGGATDTVILSVVPQNGDGKNGCNLTGSTTLTVSVASSNTGVATVTPNSVTFTSCGAIPALTVTSGSAGSAVISLTQTGNTTGATFNLAPATFTVIVTAADSTPPSISYALNPASPDGDNGWYKSDVTLTWTVTESDSPLSLVKTGCVDQSITADQAATTYSCSASSDGGSAGPVTVTIKRDGTAPDVDYTSADPALPDGDHGWYTGPVTATFTATDNLSGFGGGPSMTATDTSTTSSEGSAVTVGSPAFTDNAGNTTPAGADTSVPFMVDLTDPYNVAFVGGPGAGSSHYFGSVPAAPTCSADDDISGLDSCVVTGYSTAVGTHTMTATATDIAGRTATATRTYTVLAWTLSGFYSPVDMNDALNVVKGGSTVPLKFEVFAGSTEFTTTDAIQTFRFGKVTCGSVDPSVTDEIEQYTSGQTVLRYDTTAGQFIQNWQVPKNSATAPAGTCYQVTMTTDDGSSITAYFMTK